jgi:hypothetical protein
MVNPGDGHDEAPRAAEPPQPQTYVPQQPQTYVPQQPQTYVPQQPYIPPQPAAPPPQPFAPPITPAPSVTPMQPMTQYPAASRALTAPPPFQPAGAAPVTAPGVSAEELARALELVEKSKGRKRMGRRIVLGVAGLALCAGAAELAPLAANKAGDLAGTAAKDAYNAGIEAGRQAILNEIAQLENVTLDGAIGVAQLTKLGVKYILVPLSRLTATIEGDALQVLINAVQTARANLAHFNITVQWMDNMQTLLTAWHDNISLLPKSLNAYATADIDGALTYLTALKALLNAERSAATPTPTPKA